MKRIFAIVALGISLLTLLAACETSSSDGQPTGQGTPTETAEAVERKFDIAALTAELIEKGGPVEVGDDITQPFFSVPGQTIIVKQESIQVFTYASPADARADADLVDPTGSPVGTSMVSWVAPPHFYLRDSLLVLYVGGDSSVIDILETIMGPQFAGAGSSTIETDSAVDVQVRIYLAMMVELDSYLRAFTSGTSPAESTIESIATVSSQLEAYTKFFAELEGDQADYVFKTYEDEFRQSAESVANAAAISQEDGGNEAIAQALARIPAFAVYREQASP